MLSEILKTFFLAMTPFGELRLSIPVGLGFFHLDWQITYFVSVLGNLVPPIFFLLFLEPLSQWLGEKSVLFRKMLHWLFARTRKKYQPKEIRFGYLALLLLVAVPLPLTGAWTGSLVAFLFNVPFKIALPLIAMGVVIAGALVILAYMLGITLSHFLGWQILVGSAVLVIFLWIIYHYKTQRKGSKNAHV